MYRYRIRMVARMPTEAEWIEAEQNNYTIEEILVYYCDLSPCYAKIEWENCINDEERVVVY